MKEKTRIIVVLAIVFVIFAVSLEFSLFSSISKTGAATRCTPGWKCSPNQVNPFRYWENQLCLGDVNSPYQNCEGAIFNENPCSNGICFTGCIDMDESVGVDSVMYASTVHVDLNGDVRNLYDICLNSQQLKEWYCDFSGGTHGVPKSFTHNCPNGCENGRCKCNNACTGKPMCYSATTYKTCGDYNGDGCTEWSKASSCPSGYQCWLGGCLENAKVPGGGSPIMASLKR